MTHFSTSEAADRYEQFRPKIHNVIKGWLASVDESKLYNSAMDVACGTGDSMIPLLDIAKNVQGFDISNVMVEKALQKNLNVKVSSLENIDSTQKHDLITICMAFHWLNPDEAFKKFSDISGSGATLLIYNFNFGGHASQHEFNDWFGSYFLNKYPSPSRNSTKSEVSSMHGFNLVKKSSGLIPIVFSKVGLVKYLTTMSNVENKVVSGISYEEVEEDLCRELAGYDLSNDFVYNFSYSIYKKTTRDYGVNS
ncbi:class I SAM-dependent methyltransferase [Celerinatantimonas yamalensis]|uniref:Methyltransferase domain-containing protein n=1 Tax=Celerinatantimonas yamalensis TaxID=559956 RepID=A0ABW9G1Q5_9GAMM